VWDFATNTCLAAKETIKGRDVRAVEVGWADEDHPVVGSSLSPFSAFAPPPN
jgi:hypothetical protein